MLEHLADALGLLAAKDKDTPSIRGVPDCSGTDILTIMFL